MKKIIMDLDYTICKKTDTYSNALPNIEVINAIKGYKDKGFHITIHTARNMKTFDGNISKIAEFTLPTIIQWLENNNVPFDEVIIGKPWNDEGFYVDDNSVRPLEFVEKTYEEIIDTLDSERRKMWK